MAASVCRKMVFGKEIPPSAEGDQSRVYYESTIFLKNSVKHFSLAILGK